jgi:hypothetical protein
MMPKYNKGDVLRVLKNQQCVIPSGTEVVVIDRIESTILHQDIDTQNYIAYKVHVKDCENIHSWFYENDLVPIKAKEKFVEKERRSSFLPLLPCPFCGEKPSGMISAGSYYLQHKQDCYISRILEHTEQYIPATSFQAWEQRCK